MADGDRICFDVWLWDGNTEYEGILARLKGREFTTRVRELRRSDGGALPGRRVPMSYLEAQQQFVGRSFMAHFNGTAEGSLFQAEISSVQRCGDCTYDYVLSGRLTTLDAAELEMLRRLATTNLDNLRRRQAV